MSEIQIVQDLHNQLTRMNAQVQSLNQLVQELTNANVALRANGFLLEEAYNQTKNQFDELQAKKAEIPVPAAEPAPSEAPADQAAA